MCTFKYKGLYNIRWLLNTRIKYVVNLQYFLHNTFFALLGSAPPQCAPLRGHPTQPLLPPHSATGRKWLHTQRMNPHHQTTSPFTSGQRSAESPGSQCVCLKRAWGWTLINCQWRTVWVTRVFVRTTLWYFRHVWLSTRVARLYYLKLLIIVLVINMIDML